MAKATKIEKMIVQGVTLELSNEEAQFLIDIIGRGVVGGGRRALSDGIYRSLNGIGLQAAYCSELDFSGQITFRG